MTGLKRWTPELLTNYTPAFKPFPPPDIETACDAPIVCMSFSEAYIPYLIGLLEIFSWDDRFIGTDEERQHGVDMFTELRTIFMTATNCCCGGSNINIAILTRITVDGRIEVSTDGGDTYHDSPTAPYITTPLYPPYIATHEGANICDVADNILEAVRVAVDKFVANYTALTTVKDFLATVVEFLAGLIAVMLDAPETVVALIPTVIAFVSHAITKTPEEVAAMFTTEFYDALLCLIYCHTPEDGTYEHSDLQGIIAACASLPGGAGFGTAGEMVQGFFKFWQETGLNTIASLGTSHDADCSDCDCNEPCDNIDAFDRAAFGTIESRNDHFIEMTSEFYAGDGGYYIDLVTSDMDTCCTLSDIEFVTEGGEAQYFYHSEKLCGTNDLTVANPLGSELWYVQLGFHAVVTVRLHFTP